MAERDTAKSGEKPGRIRRLRNRLPAASVRVPLPAGMDVVVNGRTDENGAMPTTLANVLLAYLGAANTTTLYLEQKVALLARALPGDEQKNVRRLRPLARLAALPQRAASQVLLPPLQSRLPSPAEWVGMPVRIGRRQLARAGAWVTGRIGNVPEAEESKVAVSSGVLFSLARTPALLVVSGSLYSVSLVAYSVHGVADRLRLVVWQRI